MVNKVIKKQTPINDENNDQVTCKDIYFFNLYFHCLINSDNVKNV